MAQTSLQFSFFIFFIFLYLFVYCPFACCWSTLVQNAHLVKQNNFIYLKLIFCLLLKCQYTNTHTNTQTIVNNTNLALGRHSKLREKIQKFFKHMLALAFLLLIKESNMLIVVLAYWLLLNNAHKRYLCN